MATKETVLANSVVMTQDPKLSLLDKIVERQADVASRYQPVMDIDDSIKRYETLKRYIEKVLVEGEDYGKVPGVEKPFLFKSGAQKLCMLFGYVPHYEGRVQIEDWSGAQFGEPLFYYQYACILTKDGKPVGEGIGSANSWESKYRYRWVSEDEAKRYEGYEKFPKRAGTVTEFAFALDKAETTGPYGKPPAYWQRWQQAIESGEARQIRKKTKTGKEMEAWEMGGSMFRVPNDQFPDVINTCQKQGEKRAYVEATLSATGASQFFTQDEEAAGALGIDTGGHPIGTQAAADHVAQQKIADMKQRQAKPADGAKSKDFAMLKAFREIKMRIGSEAYYRILGGNGYEHANEITDSAKGRAIYREMADAEKALQESQARMSTTEPSSAKPAATIADLPDEMWLEGRD